MFKTIDEIRREQLEADLSHEPTDGDTADRITAINRAGRDFGLVVIANTPNSVDRDQALAKIREAAFWARNSVIACQKFGTETVRPQTPGEKN